MLQDKDIKKLSELKNGFTHSWLEPDFILRSLKCFSFSSLCKAIAPIKLKGYSFESIFSILISLSFLGVNSVNGLSGHIEAKKDVFYRLKNNSKINWRAILWLFCQRFINLTNAEHTDNKGLKCLIFDDTLIPKTGKFIEKVSYVWDHVLGRFVLGYKLLLMGYWDGTSFLPLDFSLHREQGKNKEHPFGLRKRDYNKQYKKKRDKTTKSYERSKEVDESKVVSVIKMFKRAVSKGLKIDYVLVDSWFTCDALIEAVISVKNQTIHLIGMYNIVKTKFLFNGKLQTYSQIRNYLGKAKRCRSLNLYYLQASVEYKGKRIQLFFSKQGKRGKWKVFITTNTKIKFIELIKIYQIRWSIEVFFKEAKQLLKMGRCQSNDFDAQIADLTITMIQHTILTLRYRFDTYESKGKLFDAIKDEIVMRKLDERLWELFVAIISIFAELIDGVDENEIIEKIFNTEGTLERLEKIFSFKDYINKAA